MIRIPRNSRILLGATVIYAVAFLYWFSVEDVSLNGAIASGLAGSLILTSHLSRVRWGMHKLVGFRILMFFGLIGLLSGVLVAPLTALLMVSKVGLHAHVYSDFTLEQVLSVLRVLPVWALTGLLFGLASGVGIYYWKSPLEDIGINNSNERREA